MGIPLWFLVSWEKKQQVICMKCALHGKWESKLSQTKQEECSFVGLEY